MENAGKNAWKTAFLRVFRGFWGGGKSSKQCIFRDFPTQTLARLPHFLVFSGVPRQTPSGHPPPKRVKIAAFRGFLPLQNRGFGHPATHPPTGPKWDVGWGVGWFSGWWDLRALQFGGVWAYRPRRARNAKTINVRGAFYGL